MGSTIPRVASLRPQAVAQVEEVLGVGGVVGQLGERGQEAVAAARLAVVAHVGAIGLDAILRDDGIDGGGVGAGPGGDQPRVNGIELGKQDVGERKALELAAILLGIDPLA